MLTYKFKKEQSTTIAYQDIDVVSAMYNQYTDPHTIEFTCSSAHNFIEGDTVRLTRYAGGYTLRDKYTVKVIDKVTFAIDAPDDINLLYNNPEFVDYDYGFMYAPNRTIYPNNRFADETTTCWDHSHYIIWSNGTAYFGNPSSQPTDYTYWDAQTYTLSIDGVEYKSLIMKDEREDQSEDFWFNFPQNMKEGIFGSGATVHYAVFNGTTFVEGATFDKDNYPTDNSPRIVPAGSTIAFTYSVDRPFKLHGNYSEWPYRTIDKKALVLHFEEDHDIVEEKPLDEGFPYISYTVDTVYYETDPKPRPCVGDYAMHNGLAYGVSALTNDNRRATIGTNSDVVDTGFNQRRNYNDLYLYYYLDGDLEKYELRATLPITSNGQVDRKKIVVFKDDGNREGQLTDISEGGGSINIYTKDRRFFIVPNNIESNPPVEIRENVQFEKQSNFLSLDIPVSTTFADNTFDEYNYLNTDVAEANNNAINPIVDYEKVVFEPSLYNGAIASDTTQLNSNLFESVESVEFNLHFRERKVDPVNNIWEIDDENTTTKGWNNYTIVSGTTFHSSKSYYLQSSTDSLTDNDADLLKHLGFTDGDVYYQKNRLSKSFLRLSFYDSRDVRKQTLQFYTDIYYDTAEAYTKFIKAVTRSADYVFDANDPNNTWFVSQEKINKGDNKEDRICARFSARDKYDYSHDSQGYYLYMFPTIVNGTIPTKLFMKAEFNHAGYGETITMSMPVNDDNIPITSSGTSENYKNFPMNYKTTTGSKSIDMDKLLRDVFIEVWVVYDYDNNKYRWFIPRQLSANNTDGKMIFNLFEPIVNPTPMESGTVADIFDTGDQFIKVNIEYSAMPAENNENNASSGSQVDTSNMKKVIAVTIDIDGTPFYLKTVEIKTDRNGNTTILNGLTTGTFIFNVKSDKPSINFHFNALMNNGNFSPITVAVTDKHTGVIQKLRKNRNATIRFDTDLNNSVLNGQIDFDIALRCENLKIANG